MIVANIFAFLLLLGEAWSEYNLTVIHISDFHSHWFEFNDRESKCSEEESKAGKCFGGFPRLLNLVQDIRKKEKNVIVLSSGEFFLGRSLNPLHGWKIASALLPKLDLDAMSLSNHDFSSGIFELSTFLYGMKFPVLCANVWARETSFLYSRVNKSAILDINGEKIGIIGYIHPETLEKSRKAVSVKFFPEIPAIKEEVKRLESYGINKLIALGHSGYHTDLDIAKNVKGVDIVIGGNSDIVVEEPYDDEDEVRTEGNIHENYPRIHHHGDSNTTETESKNKTLVLHIPQHGKYVGVIRVTFDDHGRVIHEEGKPLLLDNSIPQDIETLNYLKSAHSTLEEVTRNARLPDDSETLTQGEFEFESRKCRMQECSLGNLVTDAMLQVYQDNKHIEKPPEDPEKWGHVDAVVLNAGSIRYPLPAGNITIKDLVHSMFVGDFMKIVYMNGEQMVKMMEHSVEKYDPTGITAPGSFLQISGLRVVYDITDLPKNRVKKLFVRCENCVNNYEEVDPRKTYFVAMPSFISKGGDGFPKFPTVDPEDIGQPEILLIVEYLRKMKIVKPALDGRISFANEFYSKNYATFTKSEAPTTVSISSTRKMDNIQSETPTHESGKQISPTKTTPKSVKEQKRLNSAAKELLKNDLVTSQSLASEFEKMNLNSDIATLEKDKINSTLITTTAIGTETLNTTSLVTPQSLTKSMESKSNHSKMNHVEVEKSYSYISLMLGRDLKYTSDYEPKEKSLKNKNKSVSEKTLSQEKLFGNTTETKPEKENIKERDIVLKLKDDNTNDAPNFSFPVKRKIEENGVNNITQNPVASSSTSQYLDPDTHIMESSSTTEKVFKGNDTVNKLSNSSSILTFSANNTEKIIDLATPDHVLNAIVGENEVVDVALNEESSEDATASVSSSEETPRASNDSKLNEVKKKFSSFIQKSSLSDIEKDLINAGLEQVNENQVIIGEGDMDRISNNLKIGMHSFLQNNMAVTTMTSADDELVTTIRSYFNIISVNSTLSHLTKEPGIGTNLSIQTHFTESLSKEFIKASTETNNNEQLKNNRILNDTISNVTDRLLPQNLSKISDLHRKHVDEIKELLVNSVVNSVLDKMKTEGYNLKNVNSSDTSDKSKDTKSKKSIVKKQLKPQAEEMASSSADESKTNATILTSIHESKPNAETDNETIKASMEKKLIGSKIITDAGNFQKDSSTQSNSKKDEAREDSFKAEIGWIPWKILGF